MVLMVVVRKTAGKPGDDDIPTQKGEGKKKKKKKKKKRICVPVLPSISSTLFSAVSSCSCCYCLWF